MAVPAHLSGSHGFAQQRGEFGCKLVTTFNSSAFLLNNDDLNRRLEAESSFQTASSYIAPQLKSSCHNHRNEAKQI